MRIENYYLRSRVARRVFLLFVLCALVPLCTLAAFSYSQVQSQLSRQADEHLRKECKLVGQSFFDYLEFLEHSCSSAAARLRSAEVADHRLTASELAERLRSHFIGVTLVDTASGSAKALIATALPLPELSPEQLDHLREGQTLMTVVAPTVDEVLPRILVVREVDESRMLVGEVRRDTLWGSMDTDADLLVVADDGRLLYASDPEGLWFEDLQQAIERSPATGRFLWSAEGEGHRAAYKSLFMQSRFSVDWTVACSRPESEVLAPMRSFQRSFLLVTALSVWVVLLLSISQIRRSLVPIEMLTEATRAVAARNFDTRVDIESGDEFEDLGEAFNTMAASIRQRTGELEAANRAKTDFLANMSHELRTPMTAILGFAEICMEPDVADEERRELLEIVCRNGKHLLTVINDILDLTKIDAQKMEVERLECSPAAIASNVTALLGASAKEKQLELVIDVQDSVPETIQTDPTRLQQILLNLLGNAIKFTDSGHVRLTVYRSASAESVCGQLAFEVADTGVGMSEADAERVFAPFMQADESMSRKYGGTGLGLSISRSLARLLGGDLVCKSEVGTGSTFTLTIDPGPPAEPAGVRPSAGQETATTQRDAGAQCSGTSGKT